MGFLCGDGSFFVSHQPNVTMGINFSQLNEERLMRLIVETFGGKCFFFEDKTISDK